MRRLTTALVLSAALLAGCTDRYGRVDYGRTALLGVGVGAAAALTAGALSDDKPRPYYGNRRGYYRDGGYGYGSPRGYNGYGGYGYGAPQRGYSYSGYGYGPRGGYYGGW
ncbi:MAG: hypothetical protein ICV73_23285 [Acetobacteraceae bacterium]|nr:hypothetical protein [Acetobacteraceae bacterium]